MEKHVILYTTHCPMCHRMEMLLKQYGYTWTEVTDTKVMIDKGFKAVPWIELPDGRLMNLNQARDFFASGKN